MTRRQLVFLKSCLCVKSEQQLAVVDMINIILILAVSADASVLPNEVIHIISDIAEIFTVAGLLPEQFIPFQYHSVIV
ncbi:hypothetical protein D3C85_1847370 [compost metagenome]